MRPATLQYKKISLVLSLLTISIIVAILFLIPSINTQRLRQQYTPQAAEAGLRVNGTQLVNADGSRFIIEGVNIEFFRDPGCSLYTDGQYTQRTQTAQKFQELGINAVRINYSLDWLGQGSNVNKLLDMVQIFAEKGIYSMPSDHTYTGNQLTNSNQSYDLFRRIVEGVRARGLEKYLIMNPYNEPYNDSRDWWSEWERYNKNTLTFLRTDIGFTGVVVLDNPVWAADFDSDFSSYRSIQAHDASLLSSNTANVVFSNHWYPNIGISPSNSVFAASDRVPSLIGELGQVNPGESGLNPQFPKDVLTNALNVGVPKGFNGVFAWIWNWCDDNSMTTDWNNFTDLNAHGLIYKNYWYDRVNGGNASFTPEPTRAATNTPRATAATATITPTVSSRPTSPSPTQPTSASPTQPPTGGTTNGLTGKYYAAEEPSADTLRLTRVDAQVDFGWQNAAPIPALSPSSFSVVWEGEILTPNSSGWYGFHSTADGGVIIHVNNRLLIWEKEETDALQLQDAAIQLQANQRYPIKIEYFNTDSPSSMQVEWTIPTQGKQVIPRANLFTTGTATLSSTPTPRLTVTSGMSIIPTRTPTVNCRADINRDGLIDLEDYSLLVRDFLLTPPTNPNTDINQDGITDLSDYSILVRNFLNTCGTRPTATAAISQVQPTATPRATSTPGGQVSYVQTNAQGQLVYRNQPVWLVGANFNNLASIKARKGPNGDWYMYQNSNITMIDSNRAAYASVRAEGGNHIRFSLSYSWFRENPQQMFQVLDQHVQMAKENGLWILWDLHVQPGDCYEGYTEYCPMWTDNDLKAQFVEFWRAMADKYKNEPTVLGYGLLNEPTPPGPGWGTTWEQLALQAINAIRSVDTNHLIFYSSTSSGTFNRTISGGNIVYEVHDYEPGPGTHCGGTVSYPGDIGTWGNGSANWNKTSMLASSGVASIYTHLPIQWARENNVPLYIGEWGISGAPCFNGGVLYQQHKSEIYKELGVHNAVYAWMGGPNHWGHYTATGNTIQVLNQAKVDATTTGWTGAVHP